jgi:hypothetical protein
MTAEQRRGLLRGDGRASASRSRRTLRIAGPGFQFRAPMLWSRVRRLVHPVPPPLRALDSVSVASSPPASISSGDGGPGARPLGGRTSCERSLALDVRASPRSRRRRHRFTSQPWHPPAPRRTRSIPGQALHSAVFGGDPRCVPPTREARRYGHATLPVSTNAPNDDDRRKRSPVRSLSLVRFSRHKGNEACARRGL